MYKLSILSSDKQRDFDNPAKFNAKKRASYFSLDHDIMNFVQSLRTPTNQIGFVLQLGYFRANGKFFTHYQFKSPDIDYVLKMLDLTRKDIDFSTYTKKIPTDHRKKIIEFLQWQSLNSENQEKLKHHIQWNIPQQLTPKRVFYSAIEYCCHNKIELPSYNFLANVITHAYKIIENNLIYDVTQKLNIEHREKLDLILGTDEKKDIESAALPCSLTQLKKMNQSLRPRDIKEILKDFRLFKDYFDTFKFIIEELNVSNQMTEYFSTWVQKATLFQLNQFPDKNKVYLHLLCYLKHQFYVRHDLLVDIYLKSVQNGINTAQRKEDHREKQNRDQRNQAIRKIVSTNQSSREVLEKITAIVHAKDPLSPFEKLNRITRLVDMHNARNTTEDTIKIIKFEQTLQHIANKQFHFESLEESSRKLQLRVSELTKHLIFEKQTSHTPFLDAIDYFSQKNGILGNDASCGFLNNKEKEMCLVNNKLNVSLYKMVFFIHIANGIKSGDLNLLYSYRYKAIQHYLIADTIWKDQKEELIKTAGLENFMDVINVLPALEEKLNAQYTTVNTRFLNNENPYLSTNEHDHITLTTPKTDSSDEKYASTLLTQAGYIPVVKVLSDINHITQFTSAFKHHSIKHTKMKPQPEIIFAGIIGKGCNMNLNRLANSSIGINEDILNNVVNWCFSKKNIQTANNKVIRMLDKLYLSTAFQHEVGKMHTSSDGRKITVAVDSILASHSYKYFGKEKGVTIYMFIDERQILFYSTVISASEREAAHVIDGLLHNDVIKSDTHSTDEHGYTEIIFAVTHCMGIMNAPRPKNINKQKLYGFIARKTYKKMGYKILPSRGIYKKLIEDNWDTLLRFMTTIKLKYTPASYLLKRLSSYAKEHPLYKALKEFGRIIKSHFMLTYMDDVVLRQRIEKQLNKIEFANRFSKAIIGDNTQEFEVGTPEEQEIIAGCNILIQNCINLWNMLYLSQLIANNANPHEQKKMFDHIAQGSSSNWGHINFRGEFNFLKYTTANQNSFDMDKILSFKLAA